MSTKGPHWFAVERWRRGSGEGSGLREIQGAGDSLLVLGQAGLGAKARRPTVLHFPAEQDSWELSRMTSSWGHPDLLTRCQVTNVGSSGRTPSSDPQALTAGVPRA